jgi:C1A family cysteine protease
VEMTFALFTLLAGVAAHPFKTCDTDHLGIHTVDLNPDPVVAGKRLMVKLTGQPDQDITGGHAHVTVKALGVVIATIEADICKDLNMTCPVKKGAVFSAVLYYDIPSAAPGGVTANVNIKVEDAAKKSLSCVDVEVKIVKGLDGHQFLFAHFMRQHGKQYEASELMNRMAIFGENFLKVKAHTEKGLAWKQALNEFADMTWEEFRSTRLGYKAIPRSGVTAPLSSGAQDDAVDWRTKNAVTPVKDQGQCGSCWAFSATGSTESAWAVANPGKSIISLSEQQLVDCAGSFGNQGCNGGWMDYGFDYIKAKGLCTEDDYPYLHKDQACQETKCKPVVSVTGYVDIPEGNENALGDAVQKQPVSVAIEADQMSFQFYAGGVMDAACGTQLDHGVLAVGFGTDNGKNYWIVKNSWGANWGEKGYIRLVRGKNQCGIALAASYPTM